MYQSPTTKHASQPNYRIMTLLLLMLIVARVVPVSATAPSYTNGQSARLVLGQSAFTGKAPAVGQNRMFGPISVATDPISGKVFVADSGNHRVLRFASLEALENAANAEGVFGQPDFTSNTKRTTQDGMSNPFSLAIDSSGRLWVAEYDNHRITRFDNAATKVSGANADGVLGQPDFTSKTSATSQSGLNFPFGLDVDNAGRLWVADTENDRVLRFDNAASKTNGANADGVLGQVNYTNRLNGTMDNPSGVAVDSAGRLWVADTGVSRVLRFDNAANKANGANADGVLGQGIYTPPASQNALVGPIGVAIDGDGRLWVADRRNHRILRFDNAASKSDNANADGVLGQPNFSNNAATTSQSGMRDPFGLAIDSDGRLWVADANNNRVLRFENAASKANGANADSVLGQSDYTSNVPATSQNTMDNPSSIAVDYASGKIFVADIGNNRVLRFASFASLTNGAMAEIVLGQPNFTSTAPITSQNGMRFPIGVTLDNAGRLWIADAGNHRILRFDHAASKANGANADGVLGQPDFTSNTLATSQNALNGPNGIAIGSDGHLWVADTGNSRILRFDHAASKANGANADGVLGQADFSSMAIATSQAGMHTPSDVAVDNDGRLWVAEPENNRVLRFDNAASKANGANADGVLGQPDFISNILATTQNGMYYPSGVALDHTGRLWVADTLNQRVLRFENAASKSNGANADAVLGQPDFISDILNTSQNGMQKPYKVAADPAGRLWVVDRGNNRVLLFGEATEANLSNLIVNSIPFSPPFDPAIASYTASVTNDVTSISIIPSIADPTATATVNGILLTSGNTTATIPLSVGSNTITIVVTAEDRTTSKTTTITVTRAAAPAESYRVGLPIVVR